MPPRRHRNLPATREILAGQRMWRGRISSACPGHDLSAVFTGARTHVDDVVGRLDGVVIVLDTITLLPRSRKCFQGLQEPIVVALMQPDRRLVQHVHHAVRPDPICDARRIRCASPPESVSADRSSARCPGRRYEESDAAHDPLMIRSAIACLWPSSAAGQVRGRLLQGQRRHLEDRAGVGTVATLTWRASRRSRVPLHSGQGFELRYFASSSRTIIESVSR